MAKGCDMLTLDRKTWSFCPTKKNIDQARTMCQKTSPSFNSVDKIILKVCVPNNRAAETLKQKPAHVKGGTRPRGYSERPVNDRQACRSPRSWDTWTARLDRQPIDRFFPLLPQREKDTFFSSTVKNAYQDSHILESQSH